jgi:DNA-binding IclR family transcriptional regulator
MNGTKVRLIKSATRTLALLEFFRERQEPATVSEVKEALSIPQSSASVLLKSLVNLNYLEYRAGERRFIPTYRVTLLGDWIQKVRFGKRSIPRLMETLRSRTGETVVLGMESGAYIQYVHSLPAMHDLKFSIKIGEFKPMVRSALGLVLLSQKTNSQIRGIARRNNADELEPSFRVKEAELIREIDQIRALGYSESDNRMTPEANVIAMMAPSHQSSGPMALGIGGPAERVRPKRDFIIDTLSECIKEEW